MSWRESLHKFEECRRALNHQVTIVDEIDRVSEYILGLLRDYPSPEEWGSPYFPPILPQIVFRGRRYCILPVYNIWEDKQENPAPPLSVWEFIQLEQDEELGEGAELAVVHQSRHVSLVATPRGVSVRIGPETETEEQWDDISHYSRRALVGLYQTCQQLGVRVDWGFSAAAMDSD